MKQSRSARRRKSSVSTRFAASAVALGAAALATAPSANAATFTVTNTNDNGAGSLRDAIALANANSGADTITFQSGVTGTITLTSGELYVSDSVYIRGPGAAALSVSGAGASRVFYLYNGSTTIDVTISGLTIADGADDAGGGIADVGENLTLEDAVVSNNYAGLGGGIIVGGLEGSLTLHHATVSGNAGALGAGGIGMLYAGAASIHDSAITSNGANYGGGIASIASGPMTIDRTTISDNQALLSGGLLSVLSPSPLTVTNSTISGNSADAAGGVYLYGFSDAVSFENTTISGNSANGSCCGHGGGIDVYAVYDGTLSLNFVTIANNSAGSAGGGIYLGNGEMTITNSVIADNVAPLNPDLGGGVESTFALAYSLVESPGTANITDNGGNILNQDPALGPLQNNGGPTETHLPQAASVIVNAGDPAFAPPPSIDQRAFNRVVNGRVDMGAVELNPGTVQFSAATSSVGENAGFATITVVRIGGTDGDITVDFKTSNGSAVQPGDYASTSGKVTFLSGDATPQSFNVPIIDDSLVEGDEVFDTVLLNPTNGAALGSPSLQAVTITDFEPVAATPIPALDLFGKIAMALASILAGVWAIGRKSLWSLLIAGVLVASVASPLHAQQKPHRIKGQAAEKFFGGKQNVWKLRGVLASIAKDDKNVTLTLESGKSMTCDASKLKVFDSRKRKHEKSNLAALAAGQTVVIRAIGKGARVKIVG